MYQIGVDIGGTNIKVGLVSETLELLQSCSVRFPHDGARSVVKTIEEAVNFLLQQQNIPRGQLESVGIVVPGSIDQTGERVIDAYNLGFHDVPLKALVQEAFKGVPVYLANDANGAALAELYAGAFRGCRTAVLLTLGTGLGGGIIFGGHMFNGGMNQGVELGHMYLVNGGEHCTCGNDGCMEAYCAASALARDGKRAMLEHPESLIAVRAGGAADAVDAKLVIDCAKEGDETAKAVFDRYIDSLSSACASIYNLLDPEVIAIGGGVCQGSSTLYNCVLLADLEVVTRSCHGATVAYLPLGLDAAVNWGTTDFQFRNNFHFPVKIEAETTVDLVKMRILGTDEKDYYIEMTSGYDDSREDVIYAVSYKNKYSKETGELISKDREAFSTYYRNVG